MGTIARREGFSPGLRFAGSAVKRLPAHPRSVPPAGATPVPAGFAGGIFALLRKNPDVLITADRDVHSFSLTSRGRGLARASPYRV